MKTVYLVINNWSCESSGNVDMEDIKVFQYYEDAKKCFEEIKDQIISYNYGYSEIEEDDDYYCQSENGEYLYYHDLVRIETKEVK